MISETQREEEEELKRQKQDKNNNNGWIKTQLSDGVFDNVNYDGHVYHTKGPEKYNKDWWYSFQIDCAVYSYKYPPFPTNYEKYWNQVKKETSFVKGKEMKN